MKYVLQCKNGQCTCAETFTASNYKLRYDKRLDKMVPEFIDEDQRCPLCGQPLSFVEAESSVPDFAVSTFKGLPDEAKKAVLRKRFEQGMRHSGKEQGEQYKREKIAKFLGADR